MQTHIDRQFGDGLYTFKLGMRQICAIEEKCNAGIGEIYARLLRGCYVSGDGKSVSLPNEGAFRLIDLIEVIRQGLIGGGTGEVGGETVAITPGKATHLVDGYIEGRPYVEAWETAVAILSARIIGYTPPEAAPDPLKKKVKRPSASTGPKSSPTAR